MSGVMSSKGLGIVTEIKDPRQLLLPDVNVPQTTDDIRCGARSEN